MEFTSAVRLLSYVKASQMGHFVMVSLWYASLIINQRYISLSLF